MVLTSIGSRFPTFEWHLCVDSFFLEALHDIVTWGGCCGCAVDWHGLQVCSYQIIGIAYHLVDIFPGGLIKALELIAVHSLNGLEVLVIRAGPLNISKAKRIGLNVVDVCQVLDHCWVQLLAHHQYLIQPAFASKNLLEHFKTS